MTALADTEATNHCGATPHHPGDPVRGHTRRSTALVPALVLLLLAGLLTVEPATADVLGIGSQTTYKEYWVPHSQFTGGCLTEQKSPGSVYIEPGWLPAYEPGYACVKTVTLSIPDNVSGAAKAEIYLDLWRAGRDTTDLARFQINGGTVRRTYRGADWSRTPFIGEIPLSELRQGDNTLTFSSSSGAYHINDVMVRVTTDATHPISGPGDVTPPTGALTAVAAGGRSFDPATGGSLAVDDDTVTLTATAAGAARVEFHASYTGYDEDVDGTFTGWHNRYRNTKNPGALGVIDHIATDTTAPYTATWTLPEVPNQTGVKFKIRVVDAAGNVVDAPGGPSAPFTLTRTHDTSVHTIPGFADNVLHHGGNRLDEHSWTLALPSSYDPITVDRAYLLGSFWNNPYIAINGNPKFSAFASGEDTWTLSVRSVTPGQLRPGNNTITYSYRGSGFGEFIEKPGPMLVLHHKNGGDAVAPTITSQPADQSVTAGQTATFNVTATGTAPLTYQWQRNGTNITGATAGSYTTPATTLADSGATFRVVVSNGAGPVTSNAATLTVTDSSLGGGGGGGGTGGSVPPDAPWWDSGWHYRVGLTASAAGSARADKPAEARVDLPVLLAEAGGSGTPDPGSLRVVEIDATGAVIDAAVPFQFDPDNPGGTRGALIWLLTGTTPASTTRLYHLYFDTTGTGHPAATVTPRVTLTDNVTDAGQAAYRIATPSGTWYYQKAAGGFSSLVDTAGNDWISYSTASRASGEYRGIPNAIYPEGEFHPGATGSTSRIVAAGPLKVTLESTTTDNAWQERWEIFPGYATMTMTRAAHAYWFLYEGTPGGAVDANDTVTRSTGTTTPLATAWTGDLPAPEWAYFSDPAAGRSLFAAHHTDDTAIDSYWLMNNAMTVFGFGRNGLDRYLTGQHTITVGLTGSTSVSTTGATIRGAYQPLPTSLSSAQKSGSTSPVNQPPTVTAGPDTTATTGVALTLAGSATDDGLPDPPGTLTAAWSMISGPGTATFTDATSPTSQVTFDAAGTYLLRLSADDSTGPVTDDLTVTVTDPSGGGGSSGGPTSDDFAGTALDPRWTVVDPVGDTTVTVSGGAARIAIPAGTSHDLWTGRNLAPRLLQTVTDSDFEVEAKFDSVVTSRYQLQGIVAQQDADDLIRFDIYHDGSQVRAFAASMAAGRATTEISVPFFTAPTGPIWLRVSRVGDTWTLRYSSNGTSWTTAGSFTHALTVASVGPTAGNHGTTNTNAPAFTAVIDYVSNTAAPGGGTSTPGTGDSVISLWSGDHQAFGAVGNPQPWVNLLGNISDPDGVTAVDYRLNGGTPRTVNLGPDGKRLARPGDVNLDIARSLLRAGSNTVDVRVTDTLGQLTTHTVTIDYTPTTTWPLPYTVNWSTAASVSAVVQPVDGRWAIEGSGVRTQEIGYDRLLAIGDSSWTDYEVTVPVTVNAVSNDPAAYQSPSNGPGLGMILHWNGHYATPTGAQPYTGYQPVGAIGWYRWRSTSASLQITDPQGSPAATTTGVTLSAGNTYVFKMRVHNLAGGPEYSLKVWPQGQPEPLTWTLTHQQGSTAPTSGSLLLLAHHVDATFGAVSVTPLGSSPPSNTPPTVGAGPDAAATTGVAATLAGSVSDDGLPDPPGTLSVGWTKVSGPGTATFTDATSPTSQATFDTAGDYVLQLSADDSTGPVTDQVTITVTDPPSGGGGGGTSGAISDEFDGTSLDPVWTLIDPRGDTTLTVSGGAARLAIPAGPTHDLWTGRNYAPRLQQPIGDTDFDVQARFTSVPDTRYQYHGIVVQQDNDDLLRFDLVATGSTVFAYAGRLTAGTATDRLRTTLPAAPTGPTWVRVTRTGTDWTLRISTNGTDWTTIGTFTDPLAPTTIGPHAATHGNPAPAYTGIIDQFTVLAGGGTTTPPPTPSNVAPTVAAGPDAAATTGVAATLAGSVSDDGLPDPPGTLSVGWTKVSGPGTATFTDATSPTSQATFDTAGDYVLELSADDSTGPVTDQVTITVTDPGGGGGGGGGGRDGLRRVRRHQPGPGVDPDRPARRHHPDRVGRRRTAGDPRRTHPRPVDRPQLRPPPPAAHRRHRLRRAGPVHLRARHPLPVPRHRGPAGQRRPAPLRPGRHRQHRVRLRRPPDRRHRHRPAAHHPARRPHRPDLGPGHPHRHRLDPAHLHQRHRLDHHRHLHRPAGPHHHRPPRRHPRQPRPRLHRHHRPVHRPCRRRHHHATADPDEHAADGGGGSGRGRDDRGRGDAGRVGVR